MSCIESNDRKKPFSSLEKDLFLNVIQNYNEILTSKKTNATSILQKKNCWEQIKDEFNSSSIVTLKASTKQLIKLWYNMKAKARESKTKQNVRFLTGGGPSIIDIDPVDAKVMDIDKNILTNIEVDIDSDITGSIEVTGDENDEAWRKLTPGTECFILAEETIPSVSPTQHKKPQSCETSKTPVKKQNDKYLNNVDAYKIKILQEELEFKKKLHEEELEMKKIERTYREKLFQLEIEIKQEELNKLKNK